MRFPSTSRAVVLALLIVSASIEREAMPAFLCVYVEDADSTYRRALASGATSIEPPRDLHYGDRRAMVRGPMGKHVANRHPQRPFTP